MSKHDIEAALEGADWMPSWRTPEGYLTEAHAQVVSYAPGSVFATKIVPGTVLDQEAIAAAGLAYLAAQEELLLKLPHLVSSFTIMIEPQESGRARGVTFMRTGSPRTPEGWRAVPMADLLQEMRSTLTRVRDEEL